MTAALARSDVFVTEYGCDRRCQVEFDLDRAHKRLTINQMRVAVDDAHTAAHAQDGRVFRQGDEITVRSTGGQP